jgi:homoserine kinase type II
MATNQENPVFDAQAAAAVLGAYHERYRPRSVVPPPAGPGFSQAIIRRIEAPAGMFCLRGWPRRGVDDERIRGLHRLLAHLRARGVDYVAVPVEDREGRTLVSCHERWWQLEPWLPGEASVPGRCGADRLTAAAEALARVHLAAASFPPQRSPAGCFDCSRSDAAPAIRERLARLESWIGGQAAIAGAGLARDRGGDEESTRAFAEVAARVMSAAERCAPIIGRELHEAAELRVPLQPCLRDVWRDHVLFIGDRVTAIIDASAARTDTVACDCARLFGSLAGDDPSDWRTLLDAYQQVRPLSAQERRLVDVLDHSGTLLSGLTWVVRRYVAGRRFDEPERVLSRLREIAARAETLERRLG